VFSLCTSGRNCSSGPRADLFGAYILLHQSSNTKRAVSTEDVLGIEGHFEKTLYDNALLSRVSAFVSGQR